MLIAIDHGNKQVKTVHGNAIVSGVQKSKTRPYGRDVLKYSGSYYTLSAQRIPYQKDKTTDERFFILSLFAIAEEIEAQGAYISGLMPIDLAIGLPPEHFGAQNKAFVHYFKRKESVYSSYRKRASASRCGSPFLRRRIGNISFSFRRGSYRWPLRPSCGRG